jgi:uncharacterized protein YegL
MPHPDLTEVIVVLDRSGSMSTIRRDMEGSFDIFIAEQRQIPGACQVTLVQFDDVVEVLYEACPLSNVPRLELVPRGSTALFDGIGLALDTVSRRISSTPDVARPARVLVVIITDGQENASRIYSYDRLLLRIQKKRQVDGWEFVYLGANQDAFHVGRAMGIGLAQSYAATPAGTSEAMKGVSTGTADYRSGKGYTSPSPFTGPGRPPESSGKGGGRKLN